MSGVIPTLPPPPGGWGIGSNGLHLHAIETGGLDRYSASYGKAKAVHTAPASAPAPASAIDLTNIPDIVLADFGFSHSIPSAQVTAAWAALQVDSLHGGATAPNAEMETDTVMGIGTGRGGGFGPRANASPASTVVAAALRRDASSDEDEESNSESLSGKSTWPAQRPFSGSSAVPVGKESENEQPSGDCLDTENCAGSSRLAIRRWKIVTPRHVVSREAGKGIRLRIRIGEGRKACKGIRLRMQTRSRLSIGGCRRSRGYIASDAE